MAKSNYEDYTREQLIEELKKLSKRKKYGLVWEEEKTKERFEADAEGKLPVLVEDKKREIKTDSDKPTHIIIEGDNYHALSVLNYTHAKSIDVIYIDPPYNTGAKDWKYNNDYVDVNDSYRHSKWLQFMYNRLMLAKKLLKNDGVLICAIDENEQAHLGVLLEEIFNSYEQHCITIVHNPRGIQGTNFSYTHEYAYFVIPSEKKTIGNRKISKVDIDWRNLRDNGGESLREDARNCFYPIIINPKTAEIIDFGVVSKNEYHPESANLKIKDAIWIYPIDGSAIERKWRYARQSVESVKHLLRAKQSKGIWQIEIGKDFGSYRTVWIDSRYDSNEYGTKLIAKMVPNCDFDFPKSLYNVYDCIYAVIGSRRNAVVLDYFAGSGTTGHAVLQLNSEDGGNRQFILCTNNENKTAEQITYPRIRSAIKGYKTENEELIKGLKGNLKYYKTDFVNSEPTHRNKKLLTDKSIEMLCIKENTFDEVMNKKDIFIFKNKEKFTAILFDEMKMEEFKNEVKKLKMPVSVYVFSLEGDDFKEEFENFKNDITLCSIPEAILKVYRRIYGAGQMKLKVKK